MEQHPIPQQISSYQFRLVGDMTLKQFFQLAGGALISLLFYASPLPVIIKWPFIIFFALLGVALAFLPFEERPLEKWIIAFFRSIYSPTLFSWQKSQTPYVFFQQEAAPTGIAPTPATPSTGFVPVTSTGGTVFSKLEDAEKTFLSSVSQLFGGGTTTPSPSAPATPQGPLQVPFAAPTSVGTPGMVPKVVVEEGPAAPAPTPELKTSVVTQTVFGQSVSGRAAQFAMEAAPPNPPTVANTIVGQIFDKEGKIVSGAILEIRDAAGRPVRALKSNMLGHFIIVTPLQNGVYQIIMEKEGLTFDHVTFEAKGEIIPPIAIRAKGAPLNVATEEIVSSQQLMTN
jgi:hypothetical protein